MKKIIAVILAIAMVFSMATVFAFAEDSTENDGILNPGHGNTENDDDYKDYYTLMNFFEDLFARLNLLIEYIVTVFFPNVNDVPDLFSVAA